MSLTLIWAQARGGVIGRAGTLPWHLPEDLAHFKDLTMGHPVVMGRLTWEGLPERFRPLPGRDNYVLTGDARWKASGARAISLEQVVTMAAGKDVWIIGGARVFSALIGEAERIELTEIDEDFVGDAFAPKIPEGFERSAGPWLSSHSGLRYRFTTLTRT